MRINYFSCRNFRNLEETEIKDFDEIVKMLKSEVKVKKSKELQNTIGF